MKVVQTVAAASDARDLETWLAFHFAAGVDEIVLAGGQSADPRVHAIAAESELGKTAADLGADWVIDAKPGEYWWPRGESLKDVLAPIPPRYTVVQALRRELDAELKQRRSVEASRISEPAAMLRPIRRSGATTASAAPRHRDHDSTHSSTPSQPTGWTVRRGTWTSVTTRCNATTKAAFCVLLRDPKTTLPID